MVLKIIKSKMAKLFGLDKFEFDKIVVKSSAMDEICHLARQAYPKEFFAILNGKIDERELLIVSLTYQIYETTEESASFKLNLPLISNDIGTVHSHPSYSNLPSVADKSTFNKHGLVHMIVCRPFEKGNIAMYDLYGRPLEFYVK